MRLLLIIIVEIFFLSVEYSPLYSWLFSFTLFQRSSAIKVFLIHIQVLQRFISNSVMADIQKLNLRNENRKVFAHMSYPALENSYNYYDFEFVSTKWLKINGFLFWHGHIHIHTHTDILFNDTKTTKTELQKEWNDCFDIYFISRISWFRTCIQVELQRNLISCHLHISLLLSHMNALRFFETLDIVYSEWCLV